MWRVGTKLGRTLYENDRVVGMVDTPEIAARIVNTMNAATPFTTAALPSAVPNRVTELVSAHSSVAFEITRRAESEAVHALRDAGHSCIEVRSHLSSSFQIGDGRPTALVITELVFPKNSFDLKVRTRVQLLDEDGGFVEP